jgi:uncharacterized protein YqeY
MSLYNDLRNELHIAMKENAEDKKNLLRIVIGEVQRKFGAESDEDVHRVVRKLIEGNNESQKLRTNAGLPEDQHLLKENQMLQAYLPVFWSQEQIEVALQNVSIKEAKNEGAAIGSAMKALKSVNAVVDGKDVKAVVQKIRS